METEVKRMSEIPLAEEPGTFLDIWTISQYRGLSYRKTNRKKIDEFLKIEVFDPLQMQDTFFEIPKEKQHRFTNWLFFR